MSPIRFAGAALLMGAFWSAPAQSTSMPSYWRYAHPDARFLIGADVKSLLGSPLGAVLKQRLAGGTFSTNATGDEIDLLYSIDRILVSSPGSPTEFSSARQPDMVVAVQGSFDAAKVRKIVAGKGSKKSYRGIEMWTDNTPGSKGMVAIASPQVLLFGDQRSLHAAIDNYASASAAKAYDPVFLRGAELAPIYDLWLVGEAPPNALAGGGAPQMAAFEKVKSFEMGLSFKTGVDFQFNMNADSEENAKTLAQGLAGLMAFAAASKADDPQIGEMMKRIRFGNAGAQAQIAASWSLAEVESGINSLQAQILGSAADAFSSIQARPAVKGGTGWEVKAAPARATVANADPRPAAPPEPPQPAGPLKVRILNADGGNKEVVISQP